MNEIVYHSVKKPINNRLVLFGSGIFLVLILYIVAGMPLVWTPAVIVFCILVGMKAWRLHGYKQNEPLVIVNDSGITDYSYGLGFVPWDNIRAIRLFDLQRLHRKYKTIELLLHDEDQFFQEETRDRKLIKKGMSSGITGIWINTWQLNSSPEEIVETLHAFHRNHKSQKGGV